VLKKQLAVFDPFDGRAGLERQQRLTVDNLWSFGNARCLDRRRHSCIDLLLLSARSSFAQPRWPTIPALLRSAIRRQPMA
jgi:hypothetical protein